MIDLLSFLSSKVKDLNPNEKSGTYRRDLFKVLIESYPPGTKIPLAEFEKVANYNGHNSVYSALHRLQKTGHIASYSLPKGGFSYEVLIPPNQYEEERKLASESSGEAYLTEASAHTAEALETERQRWLDEKAKKEEPEMDKSPETVKMQTLYTWDNLETLGIKFKFYYPNGSVGDYIRWLKNEPIDDNI